MKKIKICDWNELKSDTPAYALVANVDLVIHHIRWQDEDNVSVLYGRCKHRGALMRRTCSRL